MNLKQRLNRMESEIENDSPYCKCFDNFVSQMIDGIYEGTAYKTDMSDLPKVWCDKCQKPVNQDKIRAIDEGIELAYGDESAELIEMILLPEK